MSSSSLDEEMLIDILTRLPPKSLLRCLSVSKSFHSLITTRTFISAHTTHRRRRNLLLRHYSWSHTRERFTIHNHDYSFFSSHDEELDFGFRSYAKYFEIVGSVNGLICLCDTHRVISHTVFLWNPTIRKSIVLPSPSVDFKRVWNFVHGFGFDSRTWDYKVVKVTNPSHLPVSSSQEIEIYELSKNSWRRRRTESDAETTPYCNRVISELSGQAFLHGAIHWVGYRNRAEFRGLGIVAFDLASEGFRELKLPECLVELSTLKLGLTTGAELEEGLSLVEYYGGGVRRNQWVQHGGCGVWVMNEYGVESSWVKRFDVEVCDGGVGKALRLRKDEESAVRLLMVSSGGELVCLEGDGNGGIVGLGMEGIPQSFHLEDLVETLVLSSLFGECGKKRELSRNATLILNRRLCAASQRHNLPR